MTSTWFSLLLAVAALSVATASYLPRSDSSLVIQRLRRDDGEARPQTPEGSRKVKMYAMHVVSRIQHRFANTLISTRVANNNHNVSQEVSFNVVLPETAFISDFLMEVDGKVYKAYVKEKEEARREYNRAIASGHGAAHVAVSARDSNRFDVSVNVEPRTKVTFNLTYDELLVRRLGTYNLAINLDPGQEVRDMKVDVYIKENRNLTILRVPELRSGNEVDADENTPLNTIAHIDRPSSTEAHVAFHPSPEQQKSLGHKSGPSDNGGGSHRPRHLKGLGGQFVVQYDVDRDTRAGEVMVDDGYFVHYFAPKDLLPMHKHVVFVLDVSGSMSGRKMLQLKNAMFAILDELHEGDYFNIIEFASSVTVWDLREIYSPHLQHEHTPWSSESVKGFRIPAFPVTRELIENAKQRVNLMSANGGTNLYDALSTAALVIRNGLQNTSAVSSEVRINPIIIFLTDGEPTVGRTGLDEITRRVQEVNNNPKAPIFSLSFGNDADLEFLKKLSLQNSGFARKIYEASDAALQLRNFYRQIASPLLANVTFTYKPDQVVEGSTTKTKFNSFLSGSEIIVAGKIRESPEHLSTNDVFEGAISGVAKTGDWHSRTERPYFVQPCQVPLATSPTHDVATPLERPYIIPKCEVVPVSSPTSTPATPLERLWAYLTIQQLLEEEKAKSLALGDSTQRNPKQEALVLALKYSFVTPVTSLVVVKPNTSEEATVKAADKVDSFSGLSAPRPAHPYMARADVYSSSRSSPFQPGTRGVAYPNALLAGRYSGSPGLSASLSVDTPLSVHLHMARPDVYSSSRSSPFQPVRRPVNKMKSNPYLVASGNIRQHLIDDDDTPLSGLQRLSPPSGEQGPQDLDPISLDQLEWLEGVRNGSSINLPTGTYQLDLTNQTQACPSSCNSLRGLPGTCRHLQQCSFTAIKHDINTYMALFCAIDNSFAGVCCPQILTGSSTSTDQCPIANAN